MGVSEGTLIGQIIGLVLVLGLFYLVIRWLLAATRRMNRKAEQPEQDRPAAQSESKRGG